MMDAPGVLPLAGLDLMFNSDSGENKESAVVETWQRLVQGLLGALALAGAVALAFYYAPPESSGNSGNSDQALEQQVHQLSRQVADLERADLEHDQSFSPIAVDNARESVAYIYGIYHLSSRTHGFRARVSGTGFVVAPGLLATNRHVAEPWYGDREVELAVRQGGTPVLEKLVAYFPGSPLPVNLETAAVATHGDLAVLRIEATPFTRKLRPLALSQTPPHVGESVSVLAYPMGVTGMVAKSPAVVYERLSSHPDNAETAGELAALSLIRPSATFGHIGDVTGDKLIYDAPTARGGSGGPVLNLRGEVVGINSAYIDGFSGGTLGITAAGLRPLVETAERAPVETAAVQSGVKAPAPAIRNVSTLP
jgi:S1-C subfamily serine protease